MDINFYSSPPIGWRNSDYGYKLLFFTSYWLAQF
jgi:hypothetical protein